MTNTERVQIDRKGTVEEKCVSSPLWCTNAVCLNCVNSTRSYPKNILSDAQSEVATLMNSTHLVCVRLWFKSFSVCFLNFKVIVCSSPLKCDSSVVLWDIYFGSCAMFVLDECKLCLCRENIPKRIIRSVGVSALSWLVCLFLKWLSLHSLNWSHVSYLGRSHLWHILVNVFVNLDQYSIKTWWRSDDLTSTEVDVTVVSLDLCEFSMNISPENLNLTGTYSILVNIDNIENS